MKMAIRINYSKFDFTVTDFYFLFILLSHFCGGIHLLIYEKQRLGALFLIAPVTYFIYRFWLVWILKKKVKIDFLDYEIKIKGIFFEKKLYYHDIKYLIIRKNILHSYDILINFEKNLSIFRYLINYVNDKINIRSLKNRKISFVICDVKNVEEVSKYILEKMGYSDKEINKNQNAKRLYVKYSLFEKYPFICLVFFIFQLGIVLESFDKMGFSIIFLGIYLVIIGFKFFKKEYKIVKFDDYKIKIFEKNKNKQIFAVEDFYETDNEVIINYYSGENNYFFRYNIMPRRYFKK